MRALLAYLVTGLVVLAIVFVVADQFDPVSIAARQQQAQIDAQHRVELASTVLVVKRVGLVGLGMVAVAGIIGALCLVLLLLRWLAQQTRMIYARGGVYPAYWDGHGWVPAPNEPGSQVMAALASGGRPPAPTVRAALQALEPETPQLEAGDEVEVPLAPPAFASIYTSPIGEALALPIGVGGDGPISLPLRNLSGGVIGGLQGLGKSEMMASMIVGLLRQDATGTRLRIGLIDMKGGLDFGRMPGDLSALEWPVASNEGAAVALTAQLWGEIERRQGLLARAGRPNLESFNADRPVGERLPYLAVFVDELMLLTVGAQEVGSGREERATSREFVSYAVRALAVGRATGISLIMATQRPSSDVVPTRLRDLAGFRLAYRCATVEASRAVLGQGGAEGLPHDPGLALLVRGETPVRLRTYAAGIEAGRFDAFLGRLPRSLRARLPADAGADGLGAEDQPDTTDTDDTGCTVDTGGIFDRQAALARHTARRGAIEEVPPDVRLDRLTAGQRLRIWRAWQLSGQTGTPSLRETEAILWPHLTHGGDKFYVVREVVRAEMAARMERMM